MGEEIYEVNGYDQPFTVTEDKKDEFLKWTKKNNKTIKLKDNKLGNQPGSTVDATVEQNPAASNQQEISPSQNTQTSITESLSENGSLESKDDLATKPLWAATSERYNKLLTKYKKADQTEEDFLKYIQPGEKIEEISNPYSISGMGTRKRKVKTFGNVTEAEDPKKFKELEFLYNQWQAANEIKESSAANYDDLSPVEIQEQARKNKEVIIDELKPLTSENKEDFNFTQTDLQNYENQERVTDFELHMADVVSTFTADSKKQWDGLVEDKRNEYLSVINEEFEGQLNTIKKDVDNDVKNLVEVYKNKIPNLDNEIQQLTIAAQSELNTKYPNGATPEQIQEAQKRLENQIKGLQNSKQPIVDELQEQLNKEIEKIHEQSYTTIGENMESRFRDLIQEDEQIKNYNNAKFKEFEVLQDKEWNNFVKDWGLKYDNWGDDRLNNIGKILDSKGFTNLNTAERKVLLDVVLESQLRGIDFKDDDERSEYIKEYYAYFYNKLNTKESFVDGELISEPTQFYLKGVSKEIMNFANTNMTTTEKYKDEKGVEWWRLSGEPTEEYNKILNNVTIKYSDPALSSKMDMDKDGLTTNNERKAFIEHMAAHEYHQKHGRLYEQAVKWAQEVIDNPESVRDMGNSEFWSGFTSGDNKKFIPIISSIINAGDALAIQRIAEKPKEERTELEKQLLAMSSIKSQSDDIASNISTMYNIGKLSAHSVPFIAEFVLTGGGFRVASQTTKLALRKAMATRLANARVAKDGSKLLFTKKTTGLKISEKAVDGLAVLAGVAAQTAMQQWRIGENFTQRMTPEHLFSFSIDADSLLTKIDSYSAVDEEGKKMGLKSSDEGFGEAWVRAFGVTASEVFTERLGAYLPGLGRRGLNLIRKGKTPLGDMVFNSDMWRRISLGTFMRKMGLTTPSEVVAWTAKNAGWHGVLGEITEELINYPLSNLADGNDNILEGIYKYDKLGRRQGLDYQGLTEMVGSVGIMAGGFTGMGAGIGKLQGIKSPTYYVNNRRFSDWKNAEKYLKTMKNKGLLNKNLDIEIRNDYVAFDAAASYLENNGLSASQIKGAPVSKNKITASEVEVLNAIEDGDARGKLMTIDERLKDLREQKQKIQSSNQNARSKAKDIKVVQHEINKLNKERNSIIDPIKNDIIQKKTTQQYKETLANVKKIVEKNKKIKKKLDIQEATNGKQAESLALRALGLKKIGNKFVDINGKAVDSIGETPIESILEEMRTSHGFIVPGSLTTDGKSKMIVTQELAVTAKGGNVAGHEFLHFYLDQALNNEPELKIALGDSFQRHLANIDPRSVRDGEFRNRLSQYNNKPLAEQNEEAMALFLDGLASGSMEYNESIMTKIGDVIRHIANRLGFKIELNDGRDVYNFLKDFNTNIKRGDLSSSLLKAFDSKLKIGDAMKARAKEIKAESSIIKERFKEAGFTDRTIQALEDSGILFSKNVKPEIDELGKMGWTKESWKEQGADFAIAEMQTNKMLDRLIASKLKVPMNFQNTVEFTKKVYAELTPHIKNFNPEVNDSLFGWINSQITNKAGNVYNREYKITQFLRDIDARTEEGAPVIQIAADTRLEEDFIDQIGLTEKQTEQKSKLRQDLKLDSKMMNIVIKAVIKTFGTKLPDVNSKKFKEALQKAFRTELKKPIQDLIGSREKYDLFLKDNFQAVFNALPVETLIQMERNVAPENRIFTSSKRVTKPIEVDKLISEGLLPKNTNRLSGPQLHTKNKYPGKEKVLAFFRGDNMEKILGYKVGGSTLGTRKDKLAMEMGVELAFDATMETVQTPEILEKRKGILELQGLEQLNNDIAIIGKQIDRSPNIMFSKKSKKNIIEKVSDLVKETINANAITDIFNLQTRKYIGKNDYSELVQDLVYKHWLNGNIILDPNKAIVKILNKIPKDVIKQNRGTAFEQHLINLGLKTGSKYPGFKMLIEKVAEGGIPDFYAKIHGAVFNAEVKFGIARAGKTTVNYTNYKTLEFIINKYSGGNKKLIDDSVMRALKNGAKKLRKALKKQGVDLIDSKTKVPMAAHKEIGSLKALVADSATTVNGDYIAKLYNDKKYPVHYIEIAGAGLYYLGSDPLGIARELGIPKLEGNFPLKTRILPAGYKENGVTVGYKYSITAEPTISADLVSELSPVSMTDADFFNKLMNTEAVNNLKSKQAIKTFNKIAESRKKMNDLIEADLKKSGYTFVDKIKFSKGQTPAEQIRILEEDLKKRGYEFVDMNSKGMSTFDFDETLIIDGKNFVIATDPITGNQIKISSAEWPTKGTKLAAQGYKMNFDDFVNVRGGVKGPLFQKLKNRIEKYGPENNFILTARPQEAAVAIHGWLKSKGINIPIENITGLGNSTGIAKAQWMIDKFAEGYNDMYFVDDALPNVKAVKDVLEQLDIKGSSVQAKIKFSKTANSEFNEMLERTKGIGAKKIFSQAEARKRGMGKGRFDFFVPPSAEDFKGLLYAFLGKGKQGDIDLKWFKKVLFDPFAIGTRNWNTYKQSMSNEYAALKKKFPEITKSLNKKVSGTNFTNDTAVRVYLWNKAGFDIPGISKELNEKLVKHVNGNVDLATFADKLSIISRRPEGYSKPNNNWVVESIASDLNNITRKIGRSEFLTEWVENKNQIFNPENLNKIEAIYGSGFRDALENMLYRMEHGTNRTVGKDKTVNRFLNWINGSVGAVMFFNMRSALLQTISTVNFINWGDNNLFAASKAFANQPQFWKDFAFIFNSNMLKQRRAGLQIDVNANELADAFSQGRSKPEAVIRYLLEKGFLPTKMADSFAIAMGGATFYRNRLNKYIKEGMSETKAKEQAWLDFQEIAEETQQSSRPDLISQQQAGPLGRLILAWQNTPMQMTRLTKKALSDLVNGRGDPKANISKIMYYGLIQNIIFGTLQSGLAFVMFGDDDDDKRKKSERVLNGALDTLLRGTGIYGAIASTIKNTILKFKEQKEKGWTGDQTYTIIEAMNLSPPIGSKLRKIYSAIQTDKFNKGVSEKLKYRIENPALSIVGNITEALTNFPLARLINKANNVEEAITGNHLMWQRIALLSGWNRWSVNVTDEELDEAKAEVKAEKKEKKKIEKEEKKKIEQQKKEEEKKKQQEEKEAQGIKQVRCSAIKSNGKRCNMTIETKAKTAKCIYHKDYNEKEGSDMDGDGVKEYRCTATKSNGDRCKNRTENKNKKCYAHQ